MHTTLISITAPSQKKIEQEADICDAAPNETLSGLEEKTQDASTQTDNPMPVDQEEIVRSLTQENHRLETELARAQATIAQMQTGLFSRIHSEKKPSSQDVALDARVTALEQKIQSVREENRLIEADLAHSRTLYLQRQQSHELNKAAIRHEIAPLEEQVNQLNTSIANQSVANHGLILNIATETPSRDHWRAVWSHLQYLKELKQDW